MNISRAESLIFRLLPMRPRRSDTRDHPIFGPHDSLFTLISNFRETFHSVFPIANRLVRRRTKCLHTKLATIRSVVLCARRAGSLVTTSSAAPNFGKIGFEEDFEGGCRATDYGCEDAFLVCEEMM
jgi:hypothetical protein